MGTQAVFERLQVAALSTDPQAQQQAQQQLVRWQGQPGFSLCLLARETLP